MFLQVNGSINTITIIQQHLLCSSVLIIILTVIYLFLFFCIKFIFKLKTIYFHQGAGGTVSNERLYIIPFLYLLYLQFYFFIIRFVIFYLIDLAVTQHLIKDTVLPLNRIVKILFRIIKSRIIGNRTEKCDLSQRQFLAALTEIPLGRRFQSIIAVGKINRIQIKLQDLVFIIFFLQFHRDKDFPDLSLICLICIQEDASCQLLRDRGGSLCLFTVVLDQRPESTDNPLKVNPVMRIKFLIFSYDHRRLCIIRNRMNIQIVCVFITLQYGNLLPFAVVSNRCLRCPECFRSRCLYQSLCLILHGKYIFSIFKIKKQPANQDRQQQ